MAGFRVIRAGKNSCHAPDGFASGKECFIRARKCFVSVAKSSPYRTGPILLASRNVCIEMAPESGK